jgi:hypothetical protein
MRRFLILLAAAALTVSVAVPASAVTTPTTTGTWHLVPAQTHSSSSSTTTSTVYKTLVRPPINADGSSNFPKKRGVIPVQFDLQSATRTDVATTTTTGPVIFESIIDNDPSTYAYSFLALNNPMVAGQPLTFPQLDNLTANYSWLIGDCWGGSLRWQITVLDGSTEKTVHLYYGTAPQFGNADGSNPNGVNGCGGSEGAAATQSGVNMIDLAKAEQLSNTQGRFDLNQDFGGPFYGTYAETTAALGTLPIVQLNLVVDSGWQTFPNSSPFHNGDEKLNLLGASANDNIWTPEPAVSVVTHVITDSAFAATCTLPAAKIEVVKNDASPDGTANETVDSVQPKDTGVYFRNVDCKYIYNLDVSTLSGQGTYYVYANINGVRVVLSPAKFDLL